MLLNVNAIDPQRLKLLWRECTPKILVVTDGLSFSASSGFGLTQFVETLRTSTIHGMTPIVLTAIHDPSLAAPIAYNSATKHIDNFKFDDPSYGVLKSRYDVVFLLGIDGTSDPALPPGGLAALAKFMQQGGGVFATGDHADLGMALSGKVPRVRAMRYWALSDTPNVASDKRLSTNMSGPNGREDFNDQSDRFPQVLYPNYRTRAGGLGNAHPVLQLPPALGLGPAVEVFPDHPHEGECHLPKDLNTTFQLDGKDIPEWPRLFKPEMVALSMSHGRGFPGKEPLTPRSFMSIVAYDGHRVNVGRVVTDATWHHFVNINLDGTGEPGMSALTVGSPAVDLPDLRRVRQYYRNLATWLMPRVVRRCLLHFFAATELLKYPLSEELRLVDPASATGSDLFESGARVEQALRARLAPFEVDEILRDVLDDVLGAETNEKTADLGPEAQAALRKLAIAGLGARVTATVSLILSAGKGDALDPHEISVPIAKATREGGQKHLAEIREQLRRAEAELTTVIEGKSAA